MATITGSDAYDTVRPIENGGSLGGLPNATAEADTINGLSGNDILFGGGGDDVINGGDFDDLLRGQDGNDTIDGGGMTDIIYGGAGNDVLRTGDGLANSEKLYGEDGDDDLTGTTNTTALNFLFGGAGNDTIRGRDNAANLADYADRALPVVANLAAGSVLVGTGEVDTLIGVRGLRSGTGSDQITGTDFNDVLMPGLGNNLVAGGLGAADRLSYADIAGNVIVDLAAGTATKSADGSIDLVSGFEVVQGTNGDDVLRGDAGDNEFRPIGGVDLVDGRGGLDTVNYASFFVGGADIYSPTGNLYFATAGVRVDLTAGIASDQGKTDRLVDIESVIGTDAVDDLTGIALADGARSELYGGAEGDVLRGTGTDQSITASYFRDPGRVLVNLSDADLTLAGTLVRAHAARDGFPMYFPRIDTIISIQSVRGSNFDDIIVGSGLADRLEGEGGNDEIHGGGGDDLLRGIGGNDLIFGEDGDDDLSPGEGSDQLDGGAGNDILRGVSGHTNGLGAMDVFTGGAGSDTFLLDSTVQSGFAVADRITDFQGGAGGDVLELGNVVVYLVNAGEIAATQNPFATGHLRVVSGSAIVQVDWDGADGPKGWTDLVILEGTTPGDLVAANFNGFDPAAAPTIVPLPAGFHFSNASVGNGAMPMGPTTTEGVAASVGASIFLIEATGGWNDLKNAYTGVDAYSAALGDHITVMNFVDARLDFSNAGDTDLTVAAIGLKRGSIETADGDDDVTLVLHSNEKTWANTVKVATGDGNDMVHATAVGLSMLDDALLADNANPANGPLWNATYGGQMSIVEADLGGGNDTIIASGVALVAKGGAGNDTLVGGNGARGDILDGGAGLDTYTGGGGWDQFILRAGEADGDVITDFEGVGAAKGDVVRLLGFGAGASVVESAPGAYAIQQGGAVVGSFFAVAGLEVGRDVFFV